MKKFQALKQDDVIGIVATGSPVEPDRMKKSLDYIHSLGFRTKVPLDPARDYAQYQNGFSNGSIVERGQALRELIVDPEVSVILTARGGYGSLDLLQSLDGSAIAQHAKPIIGMSDVTALLFQWSERFGVYSVHGPGAATSFADASDDPSAQKSVESLIELLSNPNYEMSQEVEVLREGEGSGSLLVGNLTMAVSLLGTPWDVDYQGKVLVVEEVGDSPYVVHRNLTQLHLAGKLEGLAGLIFGRFSKCQAKHGPRVEDVFKMVVQSTLENSSFPVLCGLASGHWGENLALPLGCRASISGSTLCLEESPLQGRS